MLLGVLRRGFAGGSVRVLTRALRPVQVTTILGSFALALVAAAPSAADPERCTDIADPIARLACYDAVNGYTADRKPTTTAASSAMPAPAPPATAVSPAPAATSASSHRPGFGFTEAQRAPAQAQTEPQAIQARIAKIDVTRWAPASALLDNGQTWVFVDDGQDAGLKPQDPITIKRGTAGSYVLVTAAHHSYHVRRTQ
jgi:hypothetical protein